MSIPGSASPLLLASTAAAAGGYQISRSLRFNSADSANLSRTPAVAGNRRTWTWAAWVKRSGLGSAAQSFLCSSDSATASAGVFFGVNSGGYGGGAADALTYYEDRIGAQILTTAAVFRDVSAWYHIVVSVDTTQATSTNRVKIYINSVQQTLSGTYPVQNYDSEINRASFEHSIGKHPLSGLGWQFNGYLADIHFIDGQALTPSSFTEVSATTGQLIPKAYTGSFGTNGFWLKFSDNSAATAATLGKDYSGNSNNWTPNNLSVTAGAGNDSLVDTPTSFGTDTGVGGEVRGNYCTLNPLDKATTGGALSNGNLDYAATVASWDMVRATFGISSGKWYWEVSVNSTTYGLTGIAQSSVVLNNNFFNSGVCYGYNANNGYKYEGSPFAALAYGATWNGSGDICGVAFNSDAGTLTFYKNGVSQGVAYTGLTGTFFPAHTSYPTGSATFNFGQRAFAYPLSGFKALCDTNLGAPVVAKPNTLMDVVLYTGNGSTQTISGLNFSPDFAWFKVRNNTSNHTLYDIVRGATKSLCSSNTNAEATEGGGLSAFTSDGFSLSGDNTVQGSTNANGGTYVAWTWDAGTSTVTNTQGSITSQVRANASAGFSVVAFNSGSGAPTAYTVGHGLNVAPQFIITKSRTSASYNWSVYHTSIAITTNKYLSINNTNATADNGTSIWGAAQPTSTVFGITSGNAVVANTDCIAYCFAPVVGYSSFGSYTGNGSSDGPFVYTGMRPRWLMVKSTGSGNWVMFDTARSTYNAVSHAVSADIPDSEYSIANLLDICSNGFKMRDTHSTRNSSGVIYIYMAFAENPFQYARAR